MKILLTAFDPFGKASQNPSLEALNRIDPTAFEAEIVKLALPTAFGTAFTAVRSAIDREQPDAVIALGVAGGRSAITPERVAINISDAGIADNEGYQPVDSVIIEDGPPAYFATLPVKQIVAAIKAAGLPAALSNSAGTYVCNHVMYGILDRLAQSDTNAIGGFIHVPFMSEQTLDNTDTPTLPLASICEAISISIQTVIRYLSEPQASTDI